MDVDESIVGLIIETAKERSHALSRELEIAAERQYPSSGPLLLIKALQKINESVDSKLNELASNQEIISSLSARQFHQQVNRVSKLLPYLHELLGLLDGAEIKNTPSPFVPSLLRLIREYLPNAELVLASKTSLNYSFEEIGKHLRTLLAAADLDATPDVIPEHFLVITFPRVEAENVLLHCVIAHEIGHGLYQKNDVRAALLPLITIDKKKVDSLAAALVQAEVEAAGEGDARLSLYPNENEVRAQITRFMNETASNWLEELSSDAIGLTLFGPAYFFAIIHLVVSFQLIDNPSASHPPNTLRIRLLLKMLGASGKGESTLDLLDELPPGIGTFIEHWKALSIEPSPPSIYDIIIDPIENMLERIGATAKQLLGTKRYANEAGTLKLVDGLAERILNCIPPNEMRMEGSDSMFYPDIILILNAGWKVLMCDMARFAQVYDGDYKSNPLWYKGKLNELVLKAVELDNFRIVWGMNVQIGPNN